MSKSEKIERLVQLLKYDTRQGAVASIALSERSHQELEKFESRVERHRSELKEFSEGIASSTLNTWLTAIAEQPDESRNALKWFEDSRLWLQSADSNVSQLAFSLRSEVVYLVKKAREDQVIKTNLIAAFDRLARTCAEKYNEVIEVEDKIVLASLYSEALLAISALQERDILFSELGSPIYNCVEAAVMLDRAKGFDQNADQFGSSVRDELQRLGPKALGLALEALNPSTQSNGRQGVDLSFDNLTNLGSLLQLWGRVLGGRSEDQEYDLDTIFSTAIDVIQFAGNLHAGELTQKKYAYASWLCGAHYHYASTLLKWAGASRQSEVLSIIRSGVEVIDEVVMPSGRFFDEASDVLAFRLRKIDFAMLAISADSRNESLKNYAVEELLTIFESDQERIKTVRPWLHLFNIYSKFSNDLNGGIARLQEFASQTRSEYIRERTNLTISRLFTEKTASRSQDSLDLLGRLSTNNMSIFVLKEALEWYGIQKATVIGEFQGKLDSEVRSKHNYLSLFCRIVEFDKSELYGASSGAMTGSIDATSLADWFLVAFGKSEIQALEEVSKFLLKRGRARDSERDIIAASELLEIGLSNSDDQYWYTRLAECLQELRQFDSAQEVLSKAVEKFPNDPLVALQLGLLRLRLEQPEGTLTILEEFLSNNEAPLYSAHPAIQGVYAFSAASCSRFEIAEPIYKGLVRLNPNDFRALHGIGTLMIRRNDSDLFEAVGFMLDAVKALGVADDRSQEYIFRDSLMNISECFSRLVDRSEAGLSRAEEAVELAFFSLGSWQLRDLMRSMSVVGRLGPLLPTVQRLVAQRNDVSLTRAFAQFGIGCVVEDFAFGSQHVDSEKLIAFAKENNSLGDLIGGNKGCYARVLNRLSARPLDEASLLNRMKEVSLQKHPPGIGGLVQIATTSGFVEGYYPKVYNALSANEGLDLNDLRRLLEFVLVGNLRSFLPSAEQQKIIFDDASPRIVQACSFAFLKEFDVEGLYLNCDPDSVVSFVRNFSASVKRVETGNVELCFSREIPAWDLANLERSNIYLSNLTSSGGKAHISSASGVFLS